MCFRRKRIGQIYTEDRKCILLSSQEIDVLIALDDGKYRERLEELKDELLYVSPRENKEVFEIDKKIRDKVQDLKLILNKTQDIEDETIDNKISHIIVMIKERDAKEIK